MKKRVAIEEDLSDLRSILYQKGYEVLSPSNASNADAVIVTGLDRNVMNMQEISAKARVIDASGRTPEEVLARLEKL